MRSITRSAAVAAVALTSLAAASPTLAAQRAPDLKEIGLKAPASAVAGQGISVADTTMNRGKLAAGASTTVFVLSRDSAASADDIALGQHALGGISPHNMRSATTALTIPAGTPAGSYFLVACADGRNVVAEGTKENNNCRAVALNVSVPAVQQPAQQPAPQQQPQAPQQQSQARMPSRPAFDGTSPSSGSTDTSPRVSGIADPGVSVRIYANDTCSGQIMAAVGSNDATGRFVAQVWVPAGTTRQFTAQAVDSRGNASPCSLPITYSAANAAPNAPVFSNTNLGTGTSRTVRLDGSAPAGHTVIVFDGPSCNGRELGRTGVDGAGRFAISVGADVGRNVYSAATDSRSNTCSSAAVYDRRAAVARPVITNGWWTHRNVFGGTASFEGAGEPGSGIALYDTTADCQDDLRRLAYVGVDGDGDWMISDLEITNDQDDGFWVVRQYTPGTGWSDCFRYSVDL